MTTPTFNHPAVAILDSPPPRLFGMSKSVSKASKSASAGAIASASTGLQSTSDAAHHASAVARSWFSDGESSHVIQMKSKLKALKQFKNAQENELTDTAKELLSEERLYTYFSHLMDATNVLLDGTKVEHYESLSREECEAAKRREQMRYDRLSNITFTVCLQDLKAHRFVATKLANILSMDFGSKHAAILVDDVLLEWGQESVIIPRIVSVEDKFSFKDDVVKDGEYFSELAFNRPELVEQLKTFEEEHERLSVSFVIKQKIISSIIQVIIKYNSTFYYNAVSRNCQRFVKDVVKAVKIVEPKFSSPESEKYLQQVRKGSIQVPMSFANHEDVDAYVMKCQEENELKKLSKVDINHLKSVYNSFHKGETCTQPTCQYRVLIEAEK